MKLGQLEFHVLVDGHLGLDGGAMFGVIPKPMWEKKIPSDAQEPNQTGDELLAGARRWAKPFWSRPALGDKWDEKHRDIYALGWSASDGAVAATTASIRTRSIS